MSKAISHITNHPEHLEEDASMQQLRDALKRSYKERFLMATRLYKIDKMLRKAVITHKPYISK